MGTKIKDAELISKVTGEERIPVSDGSGKAKAVRLNQVGMIEVTYDELVALRDNAQLIPGMMYRMTDYETTTSQDGTQSAGHPFDLILTALDEKTLDEKCSAIQSARDTEGYFANSDLNAWEVWYTLDNNDVRFGWGVYPTSTFSISGDYFEESGYITCKQDGVYEYKGIVYIKWIFSVMGIEVYALTENKDVKIGDSCVMYAPSMDHELGNTDILSVNNIEREGFGIIYRLIDEHRNDVAYDFKNILFTRKMEGSIYDAENGTDVYVYVFDMYEEGKHIDASLKYNRVEKNKVYGSQSISNCVFIGEGSIMIYNNVIHHNVKNVTIEGSSYENQIGRYCYNITIKEGSKNCLESYCANIGLSTECQNNFFGESCTDITLSEECFFNKFTRQNSNITLGKWCSSNTFDERNADISLGKNCNNNSFVYWPTRKITLGDSSSFNTFKDASNIDGVYNKTLFSGSGNEMITYSELDIYNAINK